MGLAAASFSFGIVDRVKIPASLEPGPYVVSFRWDCEQSAQIWNQCSDVNIKGSGRPSPPFQQLKGCEPCCAQPRGLPGICANCTECKELKHGDCARCWQPLHGWNPDM